MPATPIVLEDIFRGLVADDGDGDPLRTGAARHNANMSLLMAAINALADALGIDIGETEVGGSSVKDRLDALTQALGVSFDREIGWKVNDVGGISPILATQDLDVGDIYLIVSGDPPDSAGTALLSVTLGATELLQGGPIDVEGYAAGVHKLTRIATPPDFDEEALIDCTLTTNNADFTAGGLAIVVTATPRA